MRILLIPSSVLLLALCLGPACGDKSDDTGDPPEETDFDDDSGIVDADGDGVPASEDCDDTDPSVGAATTWYADEDGDGYGNDDRTVLACEAPDGFVSVGGDCRGRDRNVYPGAPEWCNGYDDDCDDEVDEDARDAETFYFDNDGDGYGGTDSAVVSCDRPDGSIEVGSDCDDDDPDIHPEAEDVCGDWVDNDCNGFVSDGCPYEGNAPATDADAVNEGVSWPTGTHIDGVGDLNADGYDDLLFGDSSTASGDCAAIVVLGPVSGTVHLHPAGSGVFLYGEDDDDEVGRSVSPAGDIDGDGLPDIIVGAHRESTTADSAGAAYVVLGPVTDAGTLARGSVKLLGETEYGNAGLDVADAGDTNGDGLDDVLVGAAYESSVVDRGGAAYLVQGSKDFEPGQTSSLTDADAKIVAEGPDDWYFLGYSLAGGGDVDADGYDDIVVGAPAFDNPGKAYVFYGPISGVIPAEEAGGSIEESGTGGDLGDSVAMAGDVDGDGRSEVLVGAPRVSHGYGIGGETYLLFGPVSGSHTRETVRASWVGTYYGESLGDSVTGAGDLDADGASDFAFGGSANYHMHKWHHRYPGAVYVMYGLSSGLL